MRGVYIHSTFWGCAVRNGDADGSSYDIVGSPSDKTFGIFAALGTIAFSFGDAMLPEIQVMKKSHTSYYVKRKSSFDFRLSFLQTAQCSRPSVAK